MGSMSEPCYLAIDLGAGRATAHLWTCDMGYDYVKINAEYTT